MLLGLSAVLLILSLWLLGNLVKHLRTLCSYSHLPGPPPVSFLSGHVICLLATMEKEGTSYSLRMRWSVEFPELYLIWLFNTPQVRELARVCERLREFAAIPMLSNDSVFTAIN
jgi:hypothetical protein